MTKKGPITITLIQPNLIWENVDKNLTHLDTLLAQIITKIDLIILPEMFNTSFTMNTSLSEKMNGETISWLKNIAKKKGCAICGSIMISENHSFYNRFVWIEENGVINFYNKKNLFPLAKEDKILSPGWEKKVVNFFGWNICLFICYDIRFAKWCSSKSQCDCMIFVASWPKKRINDWDDLLALRAIQNKCYVIGVNRVGKDGVGTIFPGRSAIYNPFGSLIFKDVTEKELIKNITLTPLNFNQ